MLVKDNQGDGDGLEIPLRIYAKKAPTSNAMHAQNKVLRKELGHILAALQGSDFRDFCVQGKKVPRLF
jgi:hypothetical protein